MASTTTTVADSAVTRRKPGPKRKPFDYSRWNLAFRNPADFAAYLAGYPDFAGILAYFYRLVPKTDLSRVGLRDNFIHKSTDVAEMTLDYCSRKWGRGLYMVKLNDANRASGQQEVARVWFKCEDPDLAPIYDPRTLLLNDPDNADEVARLLHMGVLVRDGEFGAPRVRTETGPPQVAMAPPAAPVPVSAPNPATPFGNSNIGDQIMLKLLERALPSATPQTASDVLEQSFQIADRLKAPAAIPAVTPTIDQIADAVALRMRPVAGAPVTGEFETWERVNNMLDKLGAGRGLDAAAPGWAAVIPLVDSFLRPLMPALLGYLGRSAPPGASPAPIRPIANNPAQLQPVPIIAPAPPAFPVFLTAEAPLMDRVVQVAQLALQKSAEGVAGFRFASWLNGYYPGGEEVYAFLESSGGSTGCMGLMSMVPDLQAQLADPVRAAALEAWLDDFFTYQADVDEAPEEPETTAA